MHASIRRYEGVDQHRAAELTGKVNETLVPKLSKLPGFQGYYLIEGGNGVFSSLGLFETPEQGEESPFGPVAPGGPTAPGPPTPVARSRHRRARTGGP